MWLPDDPERFSSKFKYIELAKWYPDDNSVKRNKKLYIWDDVEKFRNQNNNVGIYTSVFHYDNEDLARAQRLGPLYFDLDSGKDDGVEAQADTIKLVDLLLEYVPKTALRLYFTGAKGFHVELEPLAVGITPTARLWDTFRYIAQHLTDELELTTIDFQCYDWRRMWRLPNSQHQKTSLFKVEITYDQLSDLAAVKEYAREPHFETVVPEQIFNAKANEWYREFQYKAEVKEVNPMDRIRRFEQFGTGIVVKDYSGESEFDPEALFTGCPALMRIWEQAEQNHHLPHEARLFLCSILTYTPSAERYLHAILSNCDDYNPEKTQSHINDWVRRRELGIGGRPFTCDKANEWNIGCGSCELEPREKLERIDDKLIRTGRMASPSPIRYAYRRKKSPVTIDESPKE
jgi:hypothetical protein